MHIQHVAVRMVALGFIIWGLGCAVDDQGKTFLLRHAGVTLGEASARAEKHTPGHAVKAELQRTRNGVVYEVEIIDIENNTRKVHVDAETGKVIP